VATVLLAAQAAAAQVHLGFQLHLAALELAAKVVMEAPVKIAL
jgi:hypothetical protein